MRLLVISNCYPPHHVGGYELGCHEVVEGLKARGHDVLVLTSSHPFPRDPGGEAGVRRRCLLKLHAPIGFLARWKWALRLETVNRFAVRETIREFRPDVIYIWNLWFASISIATEAEETGLPVVYYVSDEWPNNIASDFSYYMFHSNRGWVGRICESIARTVLWMRSIRASGKRPMLRFPQFTSRFIRDRVLPSDYPVAKSWVIPWSVDVEKFSPANVDWPPRRFLYAGQLIEHKGVHTAIDAFAIAIGRGLDSAATLTIAGAADYSPDYGMRLKALVEGHKLNDRIHFIGRIAREKMADVYREHDVLVFPSEWNEPFAITLVEAMSSGLAIISTSTGGTPEILRSELNALSFREGIAQDCASQMVRLSSDRALYNRIRQGARNTALTEYRISGMLDKIETSLQYAIAHKVGE